MLTEEYLTVHTHGISINYVLYLYLYYIYIYTTQDQIDNRGNRRVKTNTFYGL